EPCISNRRFQATQQFRQLAAAAPIQSILSSVLRDEYNFPYAAVHHAPGLGNYLFLRFAAQFPSEAGNDAIGTPIIASFGDFQISVREGGKNAPGFGNAVIAIRRPQAGLVGGYK